MFCSKTHFFAPDENNPAYSFCKVIKSPKVWSEVPTSKWVPCRLYLVAGEIVCVNCFIISLKYLKEQISEGPIKLPEWPWRAFNGSAMIKAFKKATGAYSWQWVTVTFKTGRSFNDSSYRLQLVVRHWLISDWKLVRRHSKPSFPRTWPTSSTKAACAPSCRIDLRLTIRWSQNLILGSLMLRLLNKVFN